MKKKEALTPKLELSEKEKDQRERIIQHLTNSSDQKKENYVEIDDMTINEYYESNKKAAQGYLAPKRNKEDVRVTTGVTRNKTNTLLSSLLDYEFEPDVEAFDEYESPLKELGDMSEDMIKKSRDKETPDYDMKRVLIYKEYVDQGSVAVWEKWCEYERVMKMIQNPQEPIEKQKWTEEKKSYGECEAELIPGDCLYLGNYRQPFIFLQPFVGFRFVRSRPEAEAKYGTWDRWKYVPEKITRTVNDEENDYYDWQLEMLSDDYVEELHYFNKWTNEYQVMLNGIPMLPEGFPLEALVGICEYPISYSIAEPISPDFALGRSIPAKTKVDQALMDEMYKMMIIKTRKSYKPPMANNTGVKLSEKIFLPASMVEGVNPEKLQEIGQNQGVTAPEFNMLQYVAQIVDAGSVSPVFEGNQLPNSASATEVATLQKQSQMKLETTLVGIINLEKQMCWLRWYNIMTHWTQPIDVKLKQVREGIEEYVNVYRTETMNTDMEEGQKGKRVVEFADQLPEPEQVEAEESILSEQRGEPIKKVYINPKMLKSLKNKYRIEVVPSQQNTSELRKKMFEEYALKHMQMFPETTNKMYLQKRMAENQGLDPDKVIMQQQPQMPQMPGMPPQGGPPQGSQMGAQMAPKPQQSPSIKSLVNAQ